MFAIFTLFNKIWRNKQSNTKTCWWYTIVYEWGTQTAFFVYTSLLLLQFRTRIYESIARLKLERESWPIFDFGLCFGEPRVNDPKNGFSGFSNHDKNKCTVQY